MGGAHFFQDEDFRAAARSDVRQLVELCGLEPNSSVLDVGCGPGRLAIGLLLELGEIARYVGVDVQERHIDWCRHRLEYPGLEFLLNDAANERYNPDGSGSFELEQDERFDVIYCYSMLSHMRSAEVSDYLKTFRHHLADGGRAFLTAFVESDVPPEIENPVGYGSIPWSKPLHCVRFEEHYFRELISRAGLTVECEGRGVATDGQSTFVLSARRPGAPPDRESMRALGHAALTNRRLESLERRSRALEAERSELVRLLDAREQQIDQLKVKIDQLKVKKAERDATTADLRSKLQQARREVRALRRRNDELQQKLAVEPAFVLRRVRSLRHFLQKLVVARTSARSEEGGDRAPAEDRPAPALVDDSAPPALTEGDGEGLESGLTTTPPSDPRASRNVAVPRSPAIDSDDLVVYTALVGLYDELPSVVRFEELGVRFVCFSDVELSDPRGWEIRPLEFYSNDPKRTVLFVKSHPHLYFPDHEISLWLDASVSLLVSPLELIIDSGSAESELAAFLHPDRDCVYDEADEVVRRKLDLEDVVTDQVRRYAASGLPRRGQLHETGVLVRRHNNARIVAFDEAWWSELEKGSRRDQLGFGFLCWKLDLPVNDLAPPGVSVRNHPGFEKRKHLQNREFRRPRNTEGAEMDRQSWNLLRFDHTAEKVSSDEQTEVSDVDIVVPVHNALAHVQRCVRSLEADTGWSGRLILVNDGSDQRTSQWCAEFSEGRQRVELLRHADARGFSSACNAGLSMSSAPYTVVLNSDTVVSRGWLMKMRRVMNSNSSIGIVGPLSNAASWQSIPSFRDRSGSLAVNSLPAGFSLEDMNVFLEEVTRDLFVPLVPTLNGFCLMFSRRFMDVVGGFDDIEFPRGYGEEVDLTLRATDAGFLCAVAADTYVFHAKSRSFGVIQRDELKVAGRSALLKRYGDERLNRVAASTRQHPALEFIRGATERLFADTVR